ncbi:apoptosis-associated speck-like protein containing a CARD [Clinocottus analis]|uniref:apoptosis-associated speck-like protein containing a CARD n=1 Tax=Clinocottus analis TaxID=304258 RepID=UPI0035C1AE69
MPPKTAKKAIKDALANLSKDNFQSFCEELLDRREEPLVKRNMVEGKGYLDVGNVLVDIFTEAKAPGVVVELLREIGCSNDADKLAQEIGSQSRKPGSSDTVRPSAGETGAEGDCSEEHFVDEHRAELIDRVCNVATIMDGLLSKKVISAGIYDEIFAITNKRDKMRKLYSGALNAAGRDGKDIFYKLLEKNENYLMNDLKKTK